MCSRCEVQVACLAPTCVWRILLIRLRLRLAGHAAIVIMSVTAPLDIRRTRLLLLLLRIFGVQGRLRLKDRAA